MIEAVRGAAFFVVEDEFYFGDDAVAIGVYLIEYGFWVGRTVAVGAALLWAILRGLSFLPAVPLALGTWPPLSTRPMLWRTSPAFVSGLLPVPGRRAIGIGLAVLPPLGGWPVASGALLTGEI